MRIRARLRKGGSHVALEIEAAGGCGSA